MRQRVESAASLAGVDASRAFFQHALSASAPETLLVAHVDEEARCLELIQYEDRQQGTDVAARHIIADTARLGSAGLILAHRVDAAGRSPEPGTAEVRRYLATAAEALDVTVLDHLIFEEGECRSLRQAGLL